MNIPLWLILLIAVLVILAILALIGVRFHAGTDAIFLAPVLSARRRQLSLRR